MYNHRVYRSESEDLNRMAIETLIANGYEPERGIVLAYGIDEERGGEYVRINSRACSEYGVLTMFGFTGGYCY